MNKVYRTFIGKAREIHYLLKDFRSDRFMLSKKRSYYADKGLSMLRKCCIKSEKRHKDRESVINIIVLRIADEDCGMG